MRTYSDIEAARKLIQQGFSLFTIEDFARCFRLTNRNTVRKILQRLEKRSVVDRLVRGKYRVAVSFVESFTVSNFIYQPSYISLESALSFYGVIDGIVYEVTAITTKRTRRYSIDRRAYSYTQIKKQYYFGYQKINNILIAEPEKAVLDYMYLSFKGLRVQSAHEMNVNLINQEKLGQYLRLYKNQSFSKFIRRKVQ